MRVVRLIIRGRVQGVGYRFWTVDTATRLGLDGWVRNRSDGSVEAIAAGDDATIERFVEACRNGPRLAQVSGVEISTADPGDAVATGGFQSRPTV